MDEASNPDNFIVKPPAQEFEDYVHIQVKILSKFKQETDLDLYFEALDLGQSLLKE